MKRFGSVLWGVVLIAIGVIWTLNATGITEIDIFFRGWWTLFIIIPCFIGLFRDHDKIGNSIGLVIGVALFLAVNDILDFELLARLIVPFILICVGLSIIFKDVLSRKIQDRIKELNKEGLEEYYATFAGQKLDMSNEEFKGCSLNAVFGGIELNLKNAIIKDEKVINTSSIFGGVVITIPEGVNVKVKSTPIFGGVSSRAPIIKGENIPTLYINALCLFGGVEIK